MNCKIVDKLNLQKSFKGCTYDYIIFDTNSLTIVPYLNSQKYLSSDRIIISPFIETFKLYLTYKKLFPDARFIFVFDGGISPVILKMLPDYKKSRNSRKFTPTHNISSGGKVYDYNIQLLNILMGYFNEIVINDINRNESDFIIGYLVNNLSTNSECLVYSHDKDLLLAHNHNNNIDVLYKQSSLIDNQYRTTNYLVDSQDCINHIFDFQYLKNVNELLFYRALVGDTSDDISKPFGIKSKTIVNNMFHDAYIEDHEITFDYVINYFSNKFPKTNPTILEKFTFDFKRNIAIMNIFNFEILSNMDKIKLNDYLDQIKWKINDTIEINSIYDLFTTYGLYLTKEDLDNTFRYLKGI